MLSLPAERLVLDSVIILMISVFSFTKSLPEGAGDSSRNTYKFVNKFHEK